MKSRLNCWIFILLGGAMSLWLPTSLLILLVAFVLVRILFGLRKKGGNSGRDRFRESLRTAERVLEST